MSIDPELLRKLSAKSVSEQQGVAALVRGIHRTPGLRKGARLGGPRSPRASIGEKANHVNNGFRLTLIYNTCNPSALSLECQGIQ